MEICAALLCLLTAVVGSPLAAWRRRWMDDDMQHITAWGKMQPHNPMCVTFGELPCACWLLHVDVLLHVCTWVDLAVLIDACA